MHIVPSNSECLFPIYKSINLYTNIPLKETLEIIKTHLNENRLEKEYKTQLIKIIETIMIQNYFQFNNSLIHRLITLPITKPNYKKELRFIEKMAVEMDST